MSDFGRWLDDRMRERGLTNRGLAVRVGIDHSTISRIRSGQRTTSLEVADAIARGLGETFVVGAPATAYDRPPRTDAERTLRRVPAAVQAVR